MVSRGYEVEAFDRGNHDVYEKKPVYNFEMHTSLYGAGHHNEWITYYDRIKDRLHPIGNRFEYRFTDEDFYVYIMTHTFKRFDGSGTGRYRYALSTEEKKLLCYYMTSGAYGTTEHRVINNSCCRFTGCTGISG